MMPQLTVVPQGGLCNRLRVLLSAFSIVSRLGKPVHVAWACDGECCAAFGDLFEPLTAPGFSVGGRTWLHDPVTRKNLHLPGIVRHLVYGAQQKNFNPAKHGDIVTFAQSARRVYVSTCSSLCDYSPELARSLRPVAAVRAGIEAHTKRFGQHTVGVHIRRTDNAVSIKESPVGAFIDAMRAEVEADARTQFFLATDDAALKGRLCGIFPQRIICQEAPVRRDTLEGMKEATVDLFCLAACHKLLGSYWSSFTDAAAEIGGMPTEIIRQHI